MLVLALVTAAPGASPASAATAAFVATPTPTCAVPTDCRLWEAGRAVGVHVGMASSNGTAQHRAALLAESDTVVNHELSWSGIEPDRGVWDFTKADENHQFAVDHHLFEVGMHFAWDQAIVDDLPGWVTAITDPDELRAVLRQRAKVIFGRYPTLGRIDVINEPFETLGSNLVRNHFLDVLGPDYVDQLFSIVEAEAPPSVQLMVNEGGIEYQPAKADALVALVADLKARGHRLDAVGLQTHLSVGEPDWDLLRTTMQRLAALGTHPFISEVDVPVAPSLPDRFAVQAERYRRVVQVCLMVPACDMVDVWGVSDASTWYDWGLEPGLDPLLLDRSYRPKPAYEAFRSALLGGRLAPAAIPGVSPSVRTSGDEDLTYSLACRPTAAFTEVGYGELAHVADLFLSGNAVRLPVPVHLRWSTAVPGDGAIAYDASASIDVSTMVQRYRIETARPAIGLGGHLDLIDTVWLRFAASDVGLAFDAPAGGAVVDATPLAGSTAISSPPTAVTFSIPEAVGDTRAPGPPVAVGGSWRVQPASSSSPSTAVLGPPRLAFGVDIQLGVVFQGLSVSGGVQGHLACTAEAVVPEAATAVDAATASAVVPAAGPGSTVTPAFTG
ncbi:MAG: endo-1,4-beta-xylanase [Acidimicrobiales bacterium]